MNKEIPCPICRGNKSKTLLEETIRNKYNVSIVECESCRFVFVNPIIEQQLLNKFIFEEYYETKKVGSQIDHRFIRHFTRRAKTHIRIIKRFFSPCFKGRVLDVGCAAGFFLNEMRKSGWDVCGIEPYENCHECPVSTLKIAVERCLFQDFERNEKFDLIYFSHVFDDLPEINDVPTKTRSFLNPGGELFIEVPNFNSDTNFKKVQEGGFLENRYYFTPASLSKLLEINHFSILYFKTEEPVYLDTVRQYFVSSIKVFKKLIPTDRRSLIRVIAGVN